MRVSIALLAAAVLGPGVARGQERSFTARVVEIAGANLYLNIGTAQGLGATDTLAVRRAPGGPRVGTLAVMAATETRAMVGFVGQPFPVTRGDSLVLVPTRSAPAGVGGAAPAAAAPPPPPRTRPTGPRREEVGTSVSGSAALDVLGNHTTTVGFGADPERATRDFTVPSLRFQMTAANLPGGGQFSLSARGTQQEGTTTLFDRSTVLRVYDAHYQQDLSSVRVMAGRFFNPYERFSGVWDGALVRVGGARGLGVGVAGGFQPRSGDEAFTTSVPKLAAFAGFRTSGGIASWDADLSAHIWRPSDGTADRTFVGWSQRLRVSGVRLDHLMEFDRNATGAWTLGRFYARAGVPLTSGLELSADYWRDQLNWWDVQPDSVVVPSRERASTGLSYGSRGVWVSADVTLLLSGTQVDGHTYSGSLRFPLLGDRISLSGTGSYWTRGTTSGVVASPSLAWRLGAARPSLTYEFFRSATAGTAVVSHSGIASVSLPLAQRLQWLLQLRARFGQNLQSAGLYSSLRVTF